MPGPPVVADEAVRREWLLGSVAASGRARENPMKALRVVLSAFLFVRLLVPAIAAKPDVQALIAELKGDSAPRERTPEQWQAAHAAVLAALLPQMGKADPNQRKAPQQTYQDICWRASRPGAEVERSAAEKAIVAQLKPDTPKPARLWLIKQLQFMGRGAAAPCLAMLLAHNDPQTRECARRALQANTSPAASDALRRALEQAGNPAWRVAVINALAARGDAASVAVLVKHAGDADPSVAAAIAAALGRRGTREALEALGRLNAKGDAGLAKVVADAQLRCADAMGARGEAAAVYERLFKSARAEHLRIAALQGLLAARPAQAAALVKQVLGGESKGLQAAAAEFIRHAASRAAVQALANALPQFSPAGQALLLDALAERGDPAARPAAMAAARSQDAGVRVAALAALASLGDASCVPVLAQAAAGKGAERAAARKSLRRIMGPGVDAALIAAAGAGQPRARVEAIEALAGRRTRAAAKRLLEHAADPERKVRSAAFKALGVLAGLDDVPALVKLLAAAQQAGDREAAGKALVAVCKNVSDVNACTAAILAGPKRASAAARGELLNVLGKLGGARALDAVRAALSDEATRDAAVRSLSSWPDAGALDDLLKLAREAENPVHQVLALRGYVRLVGLPSERPAAETLKMLADAMAAARRPDERKLVLAGVANVPALPALDAARQYLADNALQAEAAAAMLKIADAVSYPHREEAEAAIRDVIDSRQDARIKERAVDALADLRRYDDYIPSWLISPSYAKPRRKLGQKRVALIDVAFAPEKPKGKDVKWAAFTGDPNPRKHWCVNLDQILRGNNCAAYLVAWVRSDKEQHARLEMGSDDGLKAWLNGKEIARDDARRSCQPEQDIVGVALRRGWNRLMLKITQKSGYWAACARVRDRDGAALSGWDCVRDFSKLDALVADLKNEPMRGTAAAALLEIGQALAAKQPTDARAALRPLLAASVDQDVQKQAKAALEAMGKYEDYITTWQVSGPYVKVGVGGHQLQDVPFAPEAADPTKAEWRRVKDNGDRNRPWVVNLIAVIGGNNRAAYLRAYILSPKAQPARLEMGTDDGVLAWLNGKVVHKNNVPRPVRPGEDKARVKLAPGWNELVMKITQGAGGWGACARFRTRDGQHLGGLRYQAGPPKGFKSPRLRKARSFTGADDPFMGEYRGKRTDSHLEAKVYPLGGGRYAAALYVIRAGVSKRYELDGWAEGDEAEFEGTVGGKQASGLLKGRKLTLSNGAVLAAYERQSPTLGAKPPKGAIVLLPFTPGQAPSLAAWTNQEWKALPDGSMEVAVGKGSTWTKREFGDVRLHLEFRCPYQPTHRGQARGNSGVYLQGRYEVQVLDSFGLAPTYRDCGALYKVAAPKVNACLPPSKWQTYDIEFRASRLDEDGNEIEPASISVRQNGIVIHDKQKLPRKGKGPKASVRKGALLLQDHDNPVRYRNIWAVEETVGD